MYCILQNASIWEVSIESKYLDSYMQGVFYPILRFVAHIKQMHMFICWKITVCQSYRNLKDFSMSGTAFERLDMSHLCISFNIWYFVLFYRNIYEPWSIVFLMERVNTEFKQPELVPLSPLRWKLVDLTQEIDLVPYNFAVKKMWFWWTLWRFFHMK